MGQYRQLRRWVPDPRSSDAMFTGAAAVVAAAGALAFVISLMVNADVAVQGTALGVALLALALALRRGFAASYDVVEATEPRPQRPTAEEEPVRDRPVGRRPFLLRLVGGAGAVVILSLLAPLAFLGRPRRELVVAPDWTEGVRLIDERGALLRPEDVPEAGVATVYPEGRPRTELAATLLTRQPRIEEPTNLDWVVDDLVAYSKICTHAGCPVDMFDTATGKILCPCHQAEFDGTRGAVVTFGPASKPLPQLPLGVDDDGYLIALGDFAFRPGPTVG